ncbi:MAG: hypothetical protein ACTSRZ_17010 [Promethearchaeota archaeon]
MQIATEKEWIKSLTDMLKKYGINNNNQRNAARSTEYLLIE